MLSGLFMPLTLLTVSCNRQPSIKSVEASFGALRSVEHLSDPQKVARWMKPWSEMPRSSLQFSPNSIISGGDTLLILPKSAVDIAYTRKSNGIQGSFTISAGPREDQAGITRFFLDFRGSENNRWTGTDDWAKEAASSLDSLKVYFTKPEKIYGYAIRPITVTDTAFLFSSRTIQKSEFPQASGALFDMLIREAAKKGVTYTGVRIFNFEEMSPGKLTIYAGVGIDRPVQTGAQDSVRFKWMPYGHNLLAVDYEGPYGEVRKINEALEQYRVDNQRVIMAIPFHKYLSDGYGYSDSQIVKIRACLPVY